MNLTFKRHYKLLLLLGCVLAVLAFGLGSQRIISYTSARTGSDVETATAAGIDYNNLVDLFDSSVVHDIQVLISDEDYDLMLTTYQETGEKDYFKADVIIDGVRINEVGVRLKGNASLMTALGGQGNMRQMAEGGNLGGMPGFGQGNLGQLPEGFVPGDLPEGFDPENLPEGFQPPDFSQGNLPEGIEPPAGLGQRPGAGALPGADGGFPGGNFPGMAGKEAANIPYLIKFDEYVSGQTYQGYSKIAIRTGGTSADASIMQEPLTNGAFQVAGFAAPETAYTGFQINGEDELLYVTSEVVDETYLEKHFSDTSGVLYKAGLGSNVLDYKGEEMSAYASSFSQITRENVADLAPLIDFIRFLNQSDDAAFESGLEDYIDLGSIAGYLAVNNLLVNLDSLAAGMGNNFYLYYDESADLFTMLYWDGNESLGGLAGGGGRGGTANSSASYNLYYEGGSGMFRSGESNILITRFMSIPAFKALYEEQLIHVYETAFASGWLLDQVDAYTVMIHAANEERALTDLEAFDAAVETIRTFIQARQEFLESNPLFDEPAG